MQPTAFAFHEAALLELNQVAGVVGSMVVTTQGELLEQRLPDDLAARAEGAAPRLAIVIDALAAGSQAHGFCLRFFEHRLHVLPIPGAFLCVLTEIGSSSPLMKMALNLIARRLQ